MKEIKFRPLRRLKNGKIVVASYMQWRKIKVANYSEFSLSVDTGHWAMSDDEFVYNHKGEQLFWYNHTDAEALPKNYPDIDLACKLFGVDREHFSGEEWKLTEPIGEGFHYSIRGFDCDGVPVFSHYTADYIGKFINDVTVFEPLTVGLVKYWFGWFLYQLHNSKLNY